MVSKFYTTLVPGAGVEVRLAEKSDQSIGHVLGCPAALRGAADAVEHGEEKK